MKRLFQSKVFLTALVDFLGGIIGLIVGQFWPQYAEFTLKLWGCFQALFVPMIGIFGVEEIGKSETVRTILRTLR